MHTFNAIRYNLGWVRSSSIWVVRLTNPSCNSIVLNVYLCVTFIAEIYMHVIRFGNDNWEIDVKLKHQHLSDASMGQTPSLGQFFGSIYDIIHPDLAEYLGQLSTY